MGRPQNQFYWDNVTKLPSGKWRCIHCGGEFSGSATRVRNHLSGGHGTDISSCKRVPSTIKEMALEERLSKIARYSQVSTIGSFHASENSKELPSSSFSVCGEGTDLDLTSVFSNEGNSLHKIEKGSAHYSVPLDGRKVFYNTSEEEDSEESVLDNRFGKEEGTEESILDTLMEFLMNRNVSFNIIKDPGLRALLKMIAYVPPLFRQDGFAIMKSSLLNYEYVVDLYILEVKESWKTTGFTYMVYNLIEEGSSIHDQRNLVTGWYSPKGFFFTEGHDFANLNYHNECVAIQYISHPPFMSKCHYQSLNFTDYNASPSMWCVQDRIQWFFRDICKESEWVKNLIENSKKIYTYMMMLCTSSRHWIQEKFKEVDQHHGLHVISFTRHRTIMHLKDELQKWVSKVTEDRGVVLEYDDSDKQIISIIENDSFWCDGKDLETALTSLLEIYDLVDTLVPTAGYLHVKIQEAKCIIKAYCNDEEGLKDPTSWKYFEEYFGDLTGEKESAFSYLIPSQILSNAEGSLTLSPAGKDALERIVKREEREALNAELEAYSIRSSNPFANLSFPEYEFTDRIKLWEEYGGALFPLLKRCAIKLLSQPVSCMCNQVKKHMSQIQRSDNFILRLNYKMMVEFKNQERT